MSSTALWPAVDGHRDAVALERILARIPDLTVAELRMLAAAFDDGPVSSAARSRALAVDLPGILDTLSCFRVCEQLYAREPDDATGVTAAVLADALRAVRDALAAGIARPALSRADYALLRAPWRTAVTAPSISLPPQVYRALAVLRRMADRCHDERARDDYSLLLTATADRVAARQRERTAAARLVAVRVGRERLWDGARRQATEAARRGCLGCGIDDGQDDARASAVAVDSICRLVVVDVVEPGSLPDLVPPLLAGD